MHASSEVVAFLSVYQSLYYMLVSVPLLRLTFAVFFCLCSKPVQTLHSFNVLTSDKERLERKVSDEELGSGGHYSSTINVHGALCLIWQNHAKESGPRS